MPDQKLPTADTPAAIHLGRELVSVDRDMQEVTLRYVACNEFANRHGTVQGGFLSAMLDSATGMALMIGLPPDLTAVTTRLDVSFLKPARLGPIKAIARVIRQDQREAQVSAELMSEDGIVVATADANLRIISRER